MSKMKATYEVMLGLSAEMAIDAILLNKKKSDLEKQINQALDDWDEEAFNTLTNEYKLLTLGGN
ncbi:IDEAL domain protein [compost metagenome]